MAERPDIEEHLAALADRPQIVSMGLTMPLADWEAVFDVLRTGDSEPGRRCAALIYQGLVTALSSGGAVQ